MPRPWIATIATVVAALGVAPAAAQATVTSSSINSWDSSQPGTAHNASYLISYDNAGTTLTISGTAGGSGNVDIVCFYGNGQWTAYTPSVVVSAGAFHATLPMKTIAGHTCRLRAIPAGQESNPTSDTDTYGGPQIVVAETGLFAISGGTNDKKPYNYLVSAPTFTGAAGWGAAGNCGPFVAALTSNFGNSTDAINCAGSLLSDDLGAFGGRSEVRVDGVNAYDAASAQALFSASQSLAGFPDLSASVDWDPTTGLASSTSQESWVVCNGPNEEKQAVSTCPNFLNAGVKLQRDVSSSDGGSVVRMTDTWSSTDGRAHSLDLLYNDVVGVTTASTQRGYEFPGQSTFSAYGSGDTLPGPGAAPGSILVRTNLAAPDGDPSQAVGAITFSTPPSGFAFASNSEFEEHQILQVPAVGTTSLTYIYSTGYTVAQTRSRALDAQDQLRPLAVSVTSPASGAITSTPSVTVTGTASSGSGVSSVVVAGQTIPVGAGGNWSATVPLAPGPNTINVLATDAAGATAQGQLNVTYQLPATAPPPARCKVPRTKGMKLAAAKKALRRAHCRIGRVKHVRSNKMARGRVTSTTPGVGRRFPAGHKIKLFVSKGA